MTDPRLKGGVVVMIWEHVHIANEKLEEQFPGQHVTLRQLLHLDQLPNVPETWSSSNFDYFWVVDYANANVSTPTSFQMIRQVFSAPFDDVPSNLWEEPEILPEGSDCEQ
jgi:hypothetical protein